MLTTILLQSASAVSNAVSAGSIYTENTVTVLLMMITVLAASIQIARGYFLRILKKFTLRLAADIWWLLYIILRDASVFLAVFLGLIMFWPGIYQDFPIAVPFMPLAIDFFAIALVLMLVKDTDEEPFYNSLLTLVILIGAFLYIFGTVFITESAVQLSVLPPTVSNSTGNFWGFMYQNFNSQNNPTLAIYTFYVTFTILMICGLVAVLSSFKGGFFKRFIEPKPQPIEKNPAPAQPQPPQQKQQ